MSDTTALAGWFGSNRMLAPKVGEELKGCRHVCVPFAGGMAEVFHISASSILVNDRHRHIINLARVVASDLMRPQLLKKLQGQAFHPDTLKEAQAFCIDVEPPCRAHLTCAVNYFICCWMGRASRAGTLDEFTGNSATRWSATGGGSVQRYHSALRSLATFARTLRRCVFETMDAFDFLARCEDDEQHGLYCDPPFPGAGRKYLHNAGRTDAEEEAWHRRLRDAVDRFEKTRVVMRFYDHPLIRELYPEARWRWRLLQGRKQSNNAANEVLLVSVPGRVLVASAIPLGLFA